jgi:hypothetical protein
MNLTEIGCEGLSWIQMTQDKVPLQILEITLINILGPTNAKEFLHQPSDYQLLKDSLLHGVGWILFIIRRQSLLIFCSRQEFSESIHRFKCAQPSNTRDWSAPNLWKSGFKSSRDHKRLCAAFHVKFNHFHGCNILETDECYVKSEPVITNYRRWICPYLCHRAGQRRLVFEDTGGLPATSWINLQISYGLCFWPPYQTSSDGWLTS